MFDSRKYEGPVLGVSVTGKGVTARVWVLWMKGWVAPLVDVHILCPQALLWPPPPPLLKYKVGGTWGDPVLSLWAIRKWRAKYKDSVFGNEMWGHLSNMAWASNEKHWIPINVIGTIDWLKLFKHWTGLAVELWIPHAWMGASVSPPVRIILKRLTGERSE